MATLVSIGIFPEKKALRQERESVKLVVSGGIEGDFHAHDSERAISIVGIKTLKQMEGLKGLCTSKFSANLITDGLVLSTLEPQGLLFIGEAVLRITQVGKECFAQCRMENQTDCPIRSECAFAVVVSGDELRVGNSVK